MTTDNIENFSLDSSIQPLDSVSEPEIVCTPEESNARLQFCKNCDSFAIADETTKCTSSGCLINLMTTFKFKQCPKGIW